MSHPEGAAGEKVVPEGAKWRMGLKGQTPQGEEQAMDAPAGNQGRAEKSYLHGLRC